MILTMELKTSCEHFSDLIMSYRCHKMTRPNVRLLAHPLFGPNKDRYYEFNITETGGFPMYTCDLYLITQNLDEYLLSENQEGIDIADAVSNWELYEITQG